MGAKVYQDQQKIDKELDPEVIARRNALFEKYVAPFYNMIYKLCIKYSFNQHNVEENYTEVLVNFFRRVETYDPNRPIRTWLHICTKRHVFALEKQRIAHEVPSCDYQDIETFGEVPLVYDEGVANAMGIENYRNFYSDEVLSVIDEMIPIHRDAFLLQLAGYSAKEIAEIEYNKGTLSSRSVETIRTRLFSAKQFLKKKLTRDGKRIPDKTDNGGL